MQTTQPSAAITACTAIIAAGKELPENLTYAYLYRAKAYAFCHKDDLAGGDFTKASHLDPTLAHPYFGLGQLAMAREDFAQAAAQFTQAIASIGEDADVDVYRSDSLGHFRAEPLTMRGFALFKQKQYAEALADYAEAMRLCPTCAQPAREKALVLTLQGKFAEAVAAYDQAIAIDIRAAGAFWGRGYMLARMSHYDEAITNYSEATRLDPHFARAYKDRASAYAKLGKSEEAKRDEAEAELAEKRPHDALTSLCAQDDASTAAQKGSSQDGLGPAASGNQSSLDDAALTSLFSGKAWQARQGLWQDSLAFRSDGSFRQLSQDTTRDGKLDVTVDGAWAVSSGRLCLYTNVTLCLTGHKQGDTISLVRSDGTLEFSGRSSLLTGLGRSDTSLDVREYPLDEEFLPAQTNRVAKTLLYFIHGFGGSQPLHSPVLPYPIASIQRVTGWDVIDADFPYNVDGQLMYGEADKFATAAYVARRIKELKAKGYDRIIVGGQSLGGWTALVLSTEPGLPIDATLLVAPACCAWWYGGGADPSNPEFANNKIYFDQLIARVRYPTAAVFFADDEFEPADRGQNAITSLSGHGIANLVIDHPAGFSGHGSAWLPVFDYEFRDCLVAFLRSPKTMQCQERPLRRGDFRAVFSASVLGDWKSKSLTAADLIGKEFAIYPDGDLYRFASANATEKRSYGFGVGTLQSSFRDGMYCSTDRIKYERPTSTDELCVALVQWVAHEVLAIDATTGKVIQWWVEKRQ